jgi:mono/diheme cytochrome c family protein
MFFAGSCLAMGPLFWLPMVEARPGIPNDDGAKVYQQKCASCHGELGQGVAGVYDPAIFGERSIPELARLIERTMPEGEPEACVGDEAAAVARYIHREFYSPAARIRQGLDQPLKVELSRLTVPQYRNAVADLIAYFTPPPEEVRKASGGRRQRDRENPATDPTPMEEPGLRGEYFASAGMSKANQLINSRVDQRLEFDFGNSVPFEGLPQDQFAIVWEGSLTARDTGEYHLRVTTPNGARVYVNLDPSSGLHKLRDDSAAAGQFPLIDAWVGSGTEREESARIFLLGGRRYPLRIEFFKYQEPTASLRVEWKPPHGVWAVLEGEHLTTANSSRTFVVETGFPADDRSLGFERGASVSPDWYAAITNGAVAAAEEVVNRLPLLSGVQPLSKEQAEDPAAQAARVQQLKDFVVRVATVAFRRPLTPEEVELLRTKPFADPTQSEAAVRQAIVWILCSPSFIYSDLSPTTAPDSNAVANRLALALWDSVPDSILAAAAQSGDLTSTANVEQQAWRMLQDSRTRHKLQGFFRHWLMIEQRDLTKDATLFPGFDEAIIADWRRSLELFIDHVVWSESSDYRQLLTSEEVWLNARLRTHWGITSDPNTETDSRFVAISPDADRRAGVLTHPYMLSALAYHNNTSPIHRGVFLSRNVIGRALRSPPVAIAFENDEFPADLTMRQKVSHLTQDASCLSCHTIINPLGFALENFDAVGRWRETEGGRPIDSRSDYETENGDVVPVSSPRDVAELALQSPAAQRVFVAQLFQHMTKQVPAAYGPEVLAQLVDSFQADQYHIQRLMVRIAVLAATHSGEVQIQEPEANQ